MEDVAIRPGFNLDTAFKGHLSVVRNVLYNNSQRYFLSMDERSLKAWSREHGGTTKVLYDVQFPGYQSNFLTSIVLCQGLNLLFCASLDDNLRLYNERLRLKSCMPWSNGVVRTMLYCEGRNELITAGSYGVKIWECLMDYAAFRTDKSSDLFDIPKEKDGSVLPWCFGKYQHVRARLTLSVPGARVVTGSSAADREQANAPWCDRIALQESSGLVLAMFEGNVYAFDIVAGSLLLSYTDLHDQPVTSVVFIPRNDLLLTTSMDTCATVWRVPHGCTAQRFKTFGRAAAPLTLITADPQLKHVLSTSLDGAVTLWDLDSLVPVFKMKLSKAPISVGFYGEDRFFMATGTEVKLFNIQHLFETWMDCNSPITSLRQLSFGLIVAEFLDSSIRVLDSSSSNTDKSVVTTMPQLSSQALTMCAVSLAGARLYALLANGHIHAWELHLKRPPTFAGAWSHLAKEGIVSIVYMDGAALQTSVAERLGLPLDRATGAPLDHLLLGTQSGDCIFLDCTGDGAASFRFPAFKHQPLQLLALDLDRCTLVTVSRNQLKIWNLRDLKCTHTMETSKPITQLEVLEGRAVAGTTSGSVHVVELATGAANTASATVDHLDTVTGLGVSVYLQHFVTGGRDSHIKVFDRDKQFKRSIYVGAPVSAVAYLNDVGDLLVAMGQRLVVVRATKYDRLPEAPKGTIYDSLRGSGHVPGALQRSLSSRMQHLTRARVPADLYSNRAGARAATPPMRALQQGRASSPGQRAAGSRQSQARRGASPQLVNGFGASSRPSSQLGTARPTTVGSEGAGGQCSGSGGRSSPSSPPEGSRRSLRQQNTIKAALSTALAMDAELQQQQQQQATMAAATGGPPSGSSTDRTTTGRLDARLSPGGAFSLGGAYVRTPTPTAAGMMAAAGITVIVTPRPPPSPDTKPPPAAGGRAGAELHHTTSSFSAGPTEAGTAGGDSGGTTTGEVQPSSSSSAQCTLRHQKSSTSGVLQQHTDGEVAGVQVIKDRFPLTQHVNVSAEKTQLERTANGLPKLSQQGSTKRRDGQHQHRHGRGHSQGAAHAAASAAAGHAQPSGQAQAHAHAHVVLQEGEEDDGYEQRPVGPPWMVDEAGRIIKLGSLFVEMGMGGAGSGLASGSDGDNDDGAGDATEGPSASDTDDEDVTQYGACLSAAFRRTLPVISSASAFFDGHVPPEALPQHKKGSKAKGKGVGEAGGGGDGADGKKKKKKKKRRRRRKALASTDPMDVLKTRMDEEVRSELKAYEKHQAVQRNVTATFLPRLNSGAGPTATPSLTRQQRAAGGSSSSGRLSSQGQQQQLQQQPAAQGSGHGPGPGAHVEVPHPAGMSSPAAGGGGSRGPAGRGASQQQGTAAGGGGGEDGGGAVAEGGGEGRPPARSLGGACGHQVSFTSMLRSIGVVRSGRP